MSYLDVKQINANKCEVIKTFYYNLYEAVFFSDHYVFNIE